MAHLLKWSASQYKRWPSSGKDQLKWWPTSWNGQLPNIRGGPPLEMISLGMARGIPRPSFLEVPDLLSLLDSPRNRFYHSSNPRGPRQNSTRTSKLGNFPKTKLGINSIKIRTLNSNLKSETWNHNLFLKWFDLWTFSNPQKLYGMLWNAMGCYISQLRNMDTCKFFKVERTILLNQIPLAKGTSIKDVQI